MSTPPGSSPFVPSSPRLDAIQSVNQRVEHLVRTAQAQLMLKQVKLCRQEVLAAAGTDEVHRIFQSDSSASRTALSGSTSWRDYKNRSRAAGKRSYHKINTYLRRRDAFGLLDADMIVRGKVCDKSPGDLTVLLVEVVSDTIPSARAAVPQIDYDRYILTPKGSRSSSVYSEPREARSRTGYFGDAGHDEMDAAYYQSLRGKGGRSLSFGDGNDLNSSSDSPDFSPLQALVELRIKGYCHLDEVDQAQNPMDKFQLGSFVYALVVSVDEHSEKVYLSLNNDLIRHMGLTIRLGPTSDQSIPGGEAELNDPLIPEPPLLTESPTIAPLASASFHPSPLHPSMLPPTSGSSSVASPSAPAPSWQVSAPRSQYGPKSPSLPSKPSYGPDPPSSRSSSNTHGPSYLSSPFFPPSSTSIPSPIVGGSPYIPSHTGRPSAYARQRGVKTSEEFLRELAEEPLFKNPCQRLSVMGVPAGVSILCHAYSINQYGSLLPRRRFPQRDHYKQLRAEQNREWAQESVNRGKRLTERGQYENALKCFKHALDIDPQFAPAYVARGAVNVHLGKFVQAGVEFSTALSIDPSLGYVRRYLEQVQQKIQEQDLAQPRTPIRQPPRPRSLPQKRRDPRAKESGEDSDISEQRRHADLDQLEGRELAETAETGEKEDDNDLIQDEDRFRAW